MYFDEKNKIAIISPEDLNKKIREEPEADLSLLKYSYIEEDANVIIFLNKQTGKIQILKNKYGPHTYATKLNLLQKFIKRLFRI